MMAVGSRDSTLQSEVSTSSTKKSGKVGSRQNLSTPRHSHHSDARDLNFVATLRVDMRTGPIRDWLYGQRDKFRLNLKKTQPD